MQPIGKSDAASLLMQILFESSASQVNLAAPFFFSSLFRWIVNVACNMFHVTLLDVAACCMLHLFSPDAKDS